jgi:ASC-1-like (ASCH) protein
MFFNGNHKHKCYRELIVEAVRVRRYKTSADMLAGEKFSKMTPEVSSVTASLKIYRKLYPRQSMLAIKLRVVSYRGYKDRKGSVVNLL